jgi:hypothetical protein
MAENGIFYEKVSDENGESYYCPMDHVTDSPVAADRLPDGCVETSVVGRYAGNIQLADDLS